MLILTYIFFLVIGAACIVFPFVAHAATNDAVAMAIFGAALIAATACVWNWNKAGKKKPPQPGAGAGDEDKGFNVTIDMETKEWLIVLVIIVGGLVLAFVAHFLIPH